MECDNDDIIIPEPEPEPEPFEYNAIENPTRYRDVDLVWKLNRLMQYGSNTYTYDSAGIRTSKNGTKYEYYGNQLFSETRADGSKIKYHYGNSGIVGFTYNSNIYIYKRNALGDIIEISKYEDNALRSIAKYVYDAFGNHKVLDAYGNENNSEYFVGNINPIRYRGYYYDIETGLYYLQTRYYDPEIGRFISPDSTDYIKPTLVGGINLYSYAVNNPIGIVCGPRGSKLSSVGNLSRDYGDNRYKSYSNHLDLNFLGNVFAFNENIYSTVAGVFEGIRRHQGLGQYESLAKVSKVLMHVGYWLNVGLDAYNNYHDNTLSSQEKWVSFGVDTVYTTAVTVGSYFLGMIPYAGPFLAILVPIGVEYLWSGDLNFFGFDVDVKPILINGKTIEEWVKYWVNSWFE